MELPGLNPLGTMAAATVDPPTRKIQQVERVAASDGAQGALTQGREHPDQTANTAKARDIKALREAIERRALPAGPPPTFQMNLLEAQSGVDPALARIEVNRGQMRDGPFVQPAEAQATAKTTAQAGTAEPLAGAISTSEGAPEEPQSPDAPSADRP